MPGQRGPYAIAEADAESGRRARQSHEFRDENRGSMFCDLCFSGPFVSHLQRGSHEHGSKHVRAFRQYRALYEAASDRIQREREESARVRASEASLMSLGRMVEGPFRFADAYHASPFWCGDLTELKASLYDLVRAGIDWTTGPPPSRLVSLNTKYTKHVRRVQADLLMLAFVRVHLVALFGSMDEYRIQGALIEQLGLATNSTTNFQRRPLAAATEVGYEVINLVMPWIPNAVGLLSF